VCGTQQEVLLKNITSDITGSNRIWNHWKEGDWKMKKNIIMREGTGRTNAKTKQ
jgi:hypothetical protein